jgi:transglutaminase-like putative cysteine protease
MEFEITHTTRYRYGHPAAEAYAEARLTPPTLPSQSLVHHRLEIEPKVPTSSYIDFLGNHVDFFSLPFRHDQLVVSNRLVVRTHALPRPEAALSVSVPEALQILNSKLVDVFDYLQPTATVVIGREATLWARRFFGGTAVLGESLQKLNEAIHDEFTYKSGVTENSTPLAQVWKAKLGVCQDFAHIALSILRTVGLPCRYVCGYIEAYAPDPSRKLTGAMATHAWVEVLVPGMHWVALDPTNRQWINDRYVAVSYGRDFRDATPLRGTFKGSGGQVLTARVYMKRRMAREKEAA